jgi:hypothetical protein
MFIKVKAKSESGEYSALVNVSHIGSVLESPEGCQIICKNGDILPIKNKFADLEKGISAALDGAENTVTVKGGVF